MLSKLPAIEYKVEVDGGDSFTTWLRPELCVWTRVIYRLVRGEGHKKYKVYARCKCPCNVLYAREVE